jgi:UbiD family decarboxylase
VTLSLRSFLAALEKDHPEQIVHVTEPVDPARFEVTAVLEHLERRRKFPLVVFDRPCDLRGQASAFPIATNIYATRARCALALGLPTHDEGLALSLEYARREGARLAPEIVDRSVAPVTAVTRTADADLRELPLVRQHAMDAGPYVDLTCVLRDPDTGAYNTAFLRNMYKGPRKLGLHMSPRQSLKIARMYEERGQAAPIAIVAHHPAFHIGALNIAPLDVDDYELIGAVTGAPLRLAPSITWGDRFLIPADAEFVIEGLIPPGVREVEGPFGEFPGTYGPQRVRWVIEVQAIQHRRDAIWQNIFSGHPDTWVLGSFPKEGGLFNRIKEAVPGVRAVHLPTSAVGRFHCYISIDKRTDADAKEAARIALDAVDFVKHVFVVDADIDVFREEEVLWALATRVQADRDVEIIEKMRGSALDPSQRDETYGAKMIVDATRPLDRPFEARIEVPQDALERIDLERVIPRDQLARSV